MSMVINLVEDHNIYLCEGGPVYNGGVQPTPITYLTQWRMMGNSVVHTDEYLTQWKVSGNSQIQQYLTQWKVEGNSVVDNNAILSCGDLGQDGKYHVKISNGVDVFDIALDEPLRKVNNVADSIEFVNGVATLTRNIASVSMSSLRWYAKVNSTTGKYTYNVYSLSHIIQPAVNNNTPGNILCTIYNTVSAYGAFDTKREGIAVNASSGIVHLYDANYDQEGDLNAFLEHIQGAQFIYALDTPTTETIQSPQISVSPTNTYSSANTTPYSSFTYANPLIYSCGDYSDVDGKYHVKISNGVTIYDIPLTEPLRKVNDVADSIEFADGVATVTRNLASVDLGNLTWWGRTTRETGKSRFSTPTGVIALPNCIGAVTGGTIATALCSKYESIKPNTTYLNTEGIGIYDISNVADGQVMIYDSNANTLSQADFKTYVQGVELIYQITPIIETIQVSPFPISPTDTYTSANDTPYSAFEYKKNVEIWSCGEYSAVDGKYHILVQPLGGSIADIALDEPLRKTGNTADTLEYPTETSGKALLTIRVEESGGELSPLDTPTTELVDAPQIEEADSYSCVISQGAKAVSWSEFLYTLNYLLTDSENNLLVDSENYKLTVQS